MIHVEAAGLTDTGKKRKANEDCFFLDDVLALYVVADGMGGHAAGEVASSLAAETFHNYMKSILEKETGAESATGDETVSRRQQQLLEAMNLANTSVLQAAKAKAAYGGMGTTISAVMFADNSLVAANVGDSPIFCIHNNTIELVSTLHTFASEITADNPQVTEVDKSFHHILTQAVGVRETVDPTIVKRPCALDDIIVICSDGLTDMVSTEDVQSIVVAAQSPSEACRHLVERANDAGGEDNITVVVLKITDVSNDTSMLARAKSLFRRMTRQPAVVK